MGEKMGGKLQKCLVCLKKNRRRVNACSRAQRWSRKGFGMMKRYWESVKWQKKVKNWRKWAVGRKDGRWVYRNASRHSKKGSCCLNPPENGQLGLETRQTAWKWVWRLWVGVKALKGVLGDWKWVASRWNNWQGGRKGWQWWGRCSNTL